ncbi:hypothetical protein FRC03_010118 [Tulasnella sp. 419]|nr:hypothetical protein FRC03_010118 [Tulasnella sp. 419]
MGDLERAISYSQESIELHPAGPPDRYTPLNNLASFLWERYQRSGDHKDLEDAISLHQKTLQLSSSSHSDAPSTTLTNMAICLQDRFRHSGKFADLDDAIKYHHQVLERRPTGDVNRATPLNNLATCLQDRYRLLSDLKDLEMAIEYHEEALIYRPVGQPDRPTSLNNLATCLRERCRRKGTIEDLDRAISHHEEAIKLHPVEHPDRSYTLNNLATCFEERYNTQTSIQDLENAISYSQEALQLQTTGHPERSTILNNLGTCLYRRFQHQGVVDDIEKSVCFIREAIGLQPQDHPQAAFLMANLATALVISSAVLGSYDKVQEAADLVERATYHSTAATYHRLQASRYWIAISHGTSRLRAYQACLDLADRYILTWPSVVARHHFLSSISASDTNDAAAQALTEGLPTMAIEFLERGRTLLWQQLGRYRSPLEKLGEVDQGLAEEFEQLSNQLETLAVNQDSRKLSRLSQEEESRRYRRVWEEWELTVSKIRRVQGFSNFLQPVPFSILRQAASWGPVIVINISQHRSDAIIVLRDRDPAVVPLPGARLADIRELAHQFSKAISITESRIKRKKIIEILRLLWYDVAAPVVQKLQVIGVARRSRIWWCPTAKLSMLPLHAAGPYNSGSLDLPDLYISSYTPTLSALLRASENTQLQGKQLSNHPMIPPLLLICQQNAPGEREIDNVREESNRIKRLIPFVDILFDHEGTRDVVLEGIRKHSWIHFASHGSQNLREPFQSRFHLNGQDLTLLDIIQARLPQAEFAFLSACHSAAGDESTPDETIHLAAGLQFSGFKSVIGTLWQMPDVDGPVIAEEVYKHMLLRERRDFHGPHMDYRDAAEALNSAANIMRKNGIPVDRWINFVHIGA